MNEPAAADEQVVENEPGADPDLSLNPHQGHLDPDQKPDGETEPKPDAGADNQDGGDPPSGEGDTESKPDGDALQRKVGELAFENRQLKRQIEQQPAAPVDQGEPEPLKTLKDFSYDEQAFNGYLVEEGAKRGEARAKASMQQDAGTNAAERRQDEFSGREDAFEAENPGFKERLHNEDLRISPEMATFIADPTSDVGLHVGDYLSRNPTESAKIAGMDPTQQAREMVKLEARIGKEVVKAAAEKKKASTAPEPPTGLDGEDPGLGGGDSANPADADKMTDDEWLANRNKHLEAKRKK